MWFLNKGLHGTNINKFNLCDYSYRPHLPVSYVKDILGFENKTQCTTFLKEMEVIFADNEMVTIDCKASSLKLPVPARPAQWSNGGRFHRWRNESKWRPKYEQIMKF